MLQFNKVKVGGFTIKGLEAKGVDGNFQYKNVFEGDEDNKSINAGKSWQEAEKLRKHQRAIKKKEKVQQKKKAKVQRKKKSKSTAEGESKKQTKGKTQTEEEMEQTGPKKEL